jgi:hypothetical protein
MRSQLKTVVAVLRQEIQLGANDFGEIIGKPIGTVKKLESEALKLSEKTALKITAETGIATRWLLDGDPNKPMFCEPGWENRNWDGSLDNSYSRATFEIVQVSKAMTSKDRPYRRLRNLDAASIKMCSEWFGILAAARKDGKAGVAEYLLGQFLEKMKKRFGYDEKKNRPID